MLPGVRNLGKPRYSHLDSRKRPVLTLFELFLGVFEFFQGLWPRQRHGMRSWSTGLHSGDVWASSGYPNERFTSCELRCEWACFREFLV